MRNHEPRKPGTRKFAAYCAYATEVVHLKSIAAPNSPEAETEKNHGRRLRGLGGQTPEGRLLFGVRRLTLGK